MSGTDMRFVPALIPNFTAGKVCRENKSWLLFIRPNGVKPVSDTQSPEAAWQFCNVTSFEQRSTARLLVIYVLLVPNSPHDARLEGTHLL